MYIIFMETFFDSWLVVYHTLLGYDGWGGGRMGKEMADDIDVKVDQR